LSGESPRRLLSGESPRRLLSGEIYVQLFSLKLIPKYKLLFLSVTIEMGMEHRSITNTYRIKEI